MGKEKDYEDALRAYLENERRDRRDSSRAGQFGVDPDVYDVFEEEAYRRPGVKLKGSSEGGKKHKDQRGKRPGSWEAFRRLVMRH